MAGRSALELARLALAVALSRSAPQLGSGGALSRRGAGSTLPTAAQPGSAWRAARTQAANECVREGVSVPQIMQRLRFRNSHTTVVSRRMPSKVLENDAKEIETERLQLAVTYQSRRGRAKRAVLQRWQFEPFVRVWLSGALRASISISTLSYLQRVNAKDYLDKKQCQSMLMLCFEDWWISPPP
jgi:hypothetical protein